MHRPMFIYIKNETENPTIGPSDDDHEFCVYYSIEFESHVAKLNFKFYLILICASIFYNWMTTANL